MKFCKINKLTSEQIENNIHAKNILKNKGINAINNYSSGNYFLDPKTKKLWNDVNQSLLNLEEYLSKF